MTVRSLGTGVCISIGDKFADFVGFTRLMELPGHGTLRSKFFFFAS